MANTVNDLNLLMADVIEIAIGAWHADIEYDHDDSQEPITGQVTIDIEGVTWKGTVIRAGVYGGRGKARVVGGAGGLSTELDAKQYADDAGVQVQTVLGDMLRTAGEALSGTADSGITGGRVKAWHRSAGPVSHALVAILDELGAGWRVLRDGTIWVGKATWPDAPDFEHVLIDEDWAAGTITIASDAPTLEPGVTFRGQRIEQVVHRLTADKLRTEAWLTSAGSALRRFLGHIRRNIDYSRLYPARVDSQNADGTLQLTPDDPKVKGSGLDKVRIMLGVPGTAKVPGGVRCLLGFANGDPADPFAVGFAGTDLTELSLGAGGDFVALAQKVKAELTKIATAFTTFVPGSGGASFGQPYTTAGDVAAQKTKAD